MRCAPVLVATLLALSLAGCTEGTTQSNGAAAPGDLIEVTRIDTLVSAFNDGEGSARVLLLLSPT